MKKEIFNEELRRANKALATAHLYLTKAINNNDAIGEDYYFQSLNRYAELVAKLEDKIRRIK